MKKPNLFRSVFILCYVFIVTIIYWIGYGKPIIGIDDANIYMVYMKNFANGYGFVYNYGSERVEGFTSLLWTLIGSFFYKFSAHPELLLCLLSFILITYTLIQLAIVIDGYLGKGKVLSVPTLIVMALLLFIPGYFEWAVLSLMETGFWSSLLILLTMNICKWELNNKRIMGLNIEFALLIALIVFTRPESLLWGIIFISIRTHQMFLQYEGSVAKTAQKIAPTVLLFILSALILVKWRVHYFGFPYPNTYYAKVSDDKISNILNGFKYTLNYILKDNLFLVLIVYVIALLTGYILNRKAERFVIYLSIVAATTFFIPFITGGDHFALGRFFQPTLPILYFLILIAFTKIHHEFSISKLNYIYAAGILLLAATCCSFFLYKQKDLITQEFRIAEHGRQFGENLNVFFDKQVKMPSQGVIVAGGTAYGYKGITIDLLGLNNVAMAHADKIKSAKAIKDHASFNRDVFFKQQPDLFEGREGGTFLNDTTHFHLFEQDSTFEESFESITFKGLYKDSVFKKMYVPVLISKKGDAVFLFTYANREFLNSLNRSFYSYKEIER